MTEINEYPPGIFCWADLATIDVEAARHFYTALFGWKAVDMPAGEGNVYTMLQKGDRHVCGLYGMDKAMRQQGIPSQWQSYVSVVSADASAEKAQDLGGQLLLAPFDVMETGRMAVVQDPTGATFALWQPKLHAGAQRINEVDTLCWNELQTTDLKAAEEFYEGLFGWNVKKKPAPASTAYIEFEKGDWPIGGMLKIREEWGEVRPRWVVYFAIKDCNGTLTKAVQRGARVVMPPTDVPDVGRVAFLADPQGAVFAVIELVITIP